MDLFFFLIILINSGVGPRATYLMGELAEMEGLLVQHVTSQLLSAGLQQIACPEIFRTLVVVGFMFSLL